MREIDICFSPELLHLYDLKGKVVVVVDVLRATSTIVTGLQYGINSFIPVARLEQCEAFKKLGYITAAERDGKKAEGFDLGNSPFEYMNPELLGKNIVITTTNGTEAIKRSHDADQIIIGSFLNKRSIARHLIESDRSVIILCAGWKGKINLEDTLYAGALALDLGTNYKSDSDSVLMAKGMYEKVHDRLLEFLMESSHVKRLNKLGIQKDIEYCLQSDIYDIVPVMGNESIVPGI